jgi:hypothetical protein
MAIFATENSGDVLAKTATFGIGKGLAASLSRMASCLNA